MSKTKYTPGPWTVAPGRGYKIEQWKGDAKEDVANIRLIAAAPELLEALEWFVAAHKNGQCAFYFTDENNRGIDEINRVIKKAKGE